ncbi:hypothetical protein GGX14DRAFT_557669 [Mycena pura]|uniref:Uncharacterized protein n=1 Tax=Mycena pura TaxID=153505 RepID=A0AAD6YLK9_9AGAR|nr:hypothetical protein GGX14DRAFT_557669 [Mycena pura]
MTEVWRSEAVHMAEAMNRYLSAHAVSALVLAQDPTRRDRMWAELAASEAPHVRRELRVDPNDDYMALLRDWDKAIAEEPTDFEGHFLRLHYAVIAAVYYEHHFVTTARQKHVDGFEASMRNLPHGHANGNTLPIPQSLPSPLQSPPSPPPSDRANIDLELANALLSAPEVLLGISFYQRDEIVPGIWRVHAINRKTTAGGSYVAFEVNFFLLVPALDDRCSFACRYRVCCLPQTQTPHNAAETFNRVRDANDLAHGGGLAAAQAFMLFFISLKPPPLVKIRRYPFSESR